jgi:hypothetical protein
VGDPDAVEVLGVARRRGQLAGQPVRHGSADEQHAECVGLAAEVRVRQTEVVVHHRERLGAPPGERQRGGEAGRRREHGRLG